MSSTDNRTFGVPSAPNIFFSPLSFISRRPLVPIKPHYDPDTIRFPRLISAQTTARRGLFCLTIVFPRCHTRSVPCWHNSASHESHQLVKIPPSSRAHQYANEGDSKPGLVQKSSSSWWTSCGGVFQLRGK